MTADVNAAMRRFRCRRNRSRHRRAFLRAQHLIEGARPARFTYPQARPRRFHGAGRTRRGGRPVRGLPRRTAAPVRHPRPPGPTKRVASLWLDGRLARACLNGAICGLSLRLMVSGTDRLRGSARVVWRRRDAIIVKTASGRFAADSSRRR
jgi:hypothetical protein